MSPPKSIAHEDEAKVRLAAQRALTQPPVRDDPALGNLQQASVGTPALVRTSEGQPAFWLVPLESGRQACGYVRVELYHKVATVGAFAIGAESRGAWPEADFFHDPPARFIREIRAMHHGATVKSSMLSFDGTPAKWGWRIELSHPPGIVAFVSPHGWYLQSDSSAKAGEREG
jgi:hypothetical protein